MTDTPGASVTLAPLCVGGGRWSPSIADVTDPVPDPVPDDPPDGVPVPARAQIRHAPRYRAFVLLGTLLLAVPALVVVLATGTGQQTFPAVVFTVGIAALLGALLGGVVAVLLDRR